MTQIQWSIRSKRGSITRFFRLKTFLSRTLLVINASQAHACALHLLFSSFCASEHKCHSLSCKDLLSLSCMDGWSGHFPYKSVRWDNELAQNCGVRTLECSYCHQPKVAKAIFVCLDTFWIDLRILSLFLNIHMNPISSWDSSPADTSCHIVDLSHHCLQITTSMWFLGMMVAHWDLKLWGSFLRSLVNILTHTLMHSAQVSNR